MYSVGAAQFNRAKKFAADVHGEQKYGEFPYSKHLYDVDQVLVRFGFFHMWDIRIAGQLHDAVEDSTGDMKVTVRNRIILDFGIDVVDIVDAVTDGEGKNRKERKAALYEKLKKSRRGKIVKLADRIANVEWSLLTNLSLLRMYMKEQQDFVDHLFNRADGEDLEDMWKHLDYLIILGNHADRTSAWIDNPSIRKRN